MRLARRTLEECFGSDRGGTGAIDDWLREEGASFVTLRRGGELRGCIGTIKFHRSLYEDVRSNAEAAAFRDSRFSPLREDELAGVDVEVSVLSPLEAMSVESEEDLLEQLRPNVDGLVIKCEGCRGTFLPQVWRSLPEPVDFVRQIKVKAGLAEDFWSPEMKVWRYVVTSWKED